MARSCDPRHMRRRSAVAAVQHGDQRGKLVSRGSPRNCALFMGTESVLFCIPIM